MTRQALTTLNRTENSSRAVRESLFIKIPFPSGTLLINSGDRNFTWGADTYIPGAIAGVEGVAENITGAEEMPILHLSGIDSALVTKCLTDTVYRLPVQIAAGNCDANFSLVDTPEIIFSGFLNYPVLAYDQDKGTLDINVMTLNSLLSRISRNRGCNADQQARFPGDTGFNQVAVNGKRPVAFGKSQKLVGVYVNPVPVLIPVKPPSPIKPGSPLP